MKPGHLQLIMAAFGIGVCVIVVAARSLSDPAPVLWTKQLIQKYSPTDSPIRWGFAEVLKENPPFYVVEVRYSQENSFRAWIKKDEIHCISNLEDGHTFDLEWDDFDPDATLEKRNLMIDNLMYVGMQKASIHHTFGPGSEGAKKIQAMEDDIQARQIAERARWKNEEKKEIDAAAQPQALTSSTGAPVQRGSVDVADRIFWQIGTDFPNPPGGYTIQGQRPITAEENQIYSVYVAKNGPPNVHIPSSVPNYLDPQGRRCLLTPYND